jgi:alkylation response protein AidB-like acyl-CoA dehydrogenase
MDFTFTKEQEEFRQEVRDFIQKHPPETYPCQFEDQGYGLGGFSREFSREMGENKWVGISWPAEYGGLGKPLIYMFILKEEMAKQGAPTMAHSFAETVGISVLRHGTEEQKKQFLPSIARGEQVWATALSEPDAGSDMFGMKTTAVQKGDEFIVNGNKVWNTMAHLSDWLLLLARTDPAAPRARNMTTFVVDPKTPGITLRPVRDMSGSEAFTEIFFDDVKVPAKNMLGPLNGGFPIVMESLEGDRFWGRMCRAAASRRMLDLMVRYCKETEHHGAPLSKDALIRDTLAEIAVEVEVCRGLAYYVISLIDKGINVGLQATHEESMLKTFADELGRRAANVWMQILSVRGQLVKGSKYVPFAGGAFEGVVPYQFLFAPGVVLAGGTTQMQRRTIALRGLGLPAV